MDHEHHIQNYQYASNSRVYVNRNFNRIAALGVTLSNSNVMYLNPNFSHNVSSQHNLPLQNNPSIRPRIHVNPNFMRTNAQDPPVINNSQINTLSTYRPTNMSNPLAHPQETKTMIKPQSNTQTASTSKSRYCLVRQKVNKVLETPILQSHQNSTTLQTVKVSKYKLVSLNSVKKNLITSSSYGSSSKLSETNPNQSYFFKSKSMYRIRPKPVINNVQNTRFKFVKRNSLTTLLTSSENRQSTIRKVSITRNKAILRTSFRQSKKIIKGTMKKNNIPCPVFKKYGKCLRKERGSCDYLHDKKHVSICRNFLKGICHNKECLLSHDLTDKKMPTCHFYLQGICTKESCPYLHVKLNEKAKICQDFVKGYCEKGEKCIHRHVDCKDISKVRTRKQNSYSLNKKIDTEREKKIRKQMINKDNRKLVKVVAETQCDIEGGKDQRYFKDVADTSASAEQCDFIKPSRCKLGTLPSFIQL